MRPHVIEDAASGHTGVEGIGPGVREDLVQTVRQAIADGTYATDAKLDIAVQRMLDDPS